MRDLEIVLGLMAFSSGLMGAWFWYLASRVVAVPLRFGRVEPDTQDTGWISGLLVASNEAARLNKIASLWTAASVAIGVVENLIVTWPA
jgi:hypothetical protein